VFRIVNRYVGNLAPIPRVFPNYPAPVIRNTDHGTELAMMRWGMNGGMGNGMMNTNGMMNDGFTSRALMALVTAMADKNYADAEVVVAALAKEHGVRMTG
jgi:hypothetical protein